MDFDHSDVQRALRDALGTLLNRHAGPGRARELAAQDAYDHVLEAELRGGGFVDLFTDEQAGPLEAVLAVEQIAAELGAVTAVGHLVVLPALGLGPVKGPVVLAAGPAPGPATPADLPTHRTATPVRYGAEAGRMVVAGADGCVAYALNPDAAERVPSAYGHPLARVAPLGDPEPVPGATAERMRAWWRVGVAAEATGMMRAALGLTVRYTTERKLFGRRLGSFQALQHRLAELSVLVEGSRWLTYEAAFHGAPQESAAVAAAHTMAALQRVTRETHQITGAIGLTREHDLHLWTLRMQALRAELGGLRAHRRAVAQARWPEAAA